jgi:hypothetical protein
MFKIDTDALFIAVEGLVEVTVTRTEEVRPDEPADITAFAWILDLDDLGAQIGEVKRSPRARAILLDRDYPHTL